VINRTLSCIFGIVLLVYITIPVASALEPLWIANTSPGLELTTVAISEDGSMIVAGGDQLVAVSRDGTKLWSGWSSELLELSQDGRFIVTSLGSTVRVFDSQGLKLWDQSIIVPVTDISITPDGALIAASGGNVVQSWYNSGSGLGHNTTNQVKHIRISPAKDQIVVTTDRALRSFNLSYVPFWSDENVQSDLLEISGDGTDIVTSNGNRVLLYHGSGTLLWDRYVPGGNILALAYSRDGSTIVTGRDDNSVTVLDRNGNILWSAKAGFWVTSVGVSDTGSVIVAGSMDKKLYVFDRTGTLLGMFQAPGQIKSRSVGISGDGSRIVAVDGTNIYGFSSEQFSRSASPTPTAVTSIPATAEMIVTPSLAAATTVATTSQPGMQQTSPHIPTTTQQSGILWVLSLLPVTAAFLLWKRI
jgi:WD40 repeat protein